MKLNELLDNHGKKCILASAFNIIIGSFITIILDYCELGFFTEAICETFIWMFMGIGICMRFDCVRRLLDTCSKAC